MQQSGKKFNRFNLTPTMRLQARQMQRRAAASKAPGNRTVSLVKPSPTDATTRLTEILQLRAHELAQPLDFANTEKLGENTVILQQQHCQLALPIILVREIIPLENVTYVPGVPDFIAGVVNARGKIITLVNLELFIQNHAGSAYKPPTTVAKQSIVILELNDFEFGVLCAGFPEIQYLENTSIQPTAALILDYCSDFLNGITASGILSLNLQAIIASSAFLVIQE